MTKPIRPAIIACLLTPFLLAGCNGGEDFDDANVGGPVIEPEPGGGGPLDSSIEQISITFFDDRVENLGYECKDDPEGGGGYIGRNDAGDEVDDEGDPLPLKATCGTEATAVEFFIGFLVDETKRIKLGTFYLPAQVQQSRYQISPADIVQSPARIAADTSSPANRQALYVAALLQALDNEPNDDILQVPEAAHDVVGQIEATPPPEPLWDYENYNSGADQFVGAWDSWLTEVKNDNNADPVAGFPNTRSAVEQSLDKSLDRLRAGTYKLVTAPYSRDFVVNGEGAPFVPPMVMQLPVLVFPDGQVHGVGYAADVSNSESQQVRTDTMIAVEDGAELTRQLRLTGSGTDAWSVSRLFTEQDDPLVDLDLSGRILGISLYYLLDGEGVTSSDYNQDYAQDGAYDPGSSDASRYDGNAFGICCDDQLLQGSREGIVAVNFDEGLYGSSNNLNFYELTPKKACVEGVQPDADCSQATSVPADEKDGVNYPSTLDSDGSADEDPGVPVEQEQNKPATDGDNQETVQVQIRDDGYIVTDLDKNCEPTTYDNATRQYTDDTSGIREYRVGFVTRTEGNQTEGSLNITLHMTGPPGLQDDLPHYGLRTTARIDLGTPEKKLYRTGDSNFGDRIRALWLDQAGGAGYAFKRYERAEMGSNPPVDKKRERLSRIRGALDGNIASCN